MAAADPALLAPLRSSPERAAVLLDFDGTLAPIVERADAATALPGVRAALTALAEVYAVVAIVSGRPAAYLVPQVPEGRSEEHTSELQSLMRNSYAVFCLNKKTQNSTPT